MHARKHACARTHMHTCIPYLTTFRTSESIDTVFVRGWSELTTCIQDVQTSVQACADILADMCRHVQTCECASVCVHMRIDNGMDTYVGKCLGMTIDICIDMCRDMYMLMCVCVCMCMCLNVLYRHMYRHVHTFVYRHVYRHVQTWV